MKVTTFPGADRRSTREGTVITWYPTLELSCGLSVCHEPTWQLSCKFSRESTQMPVFKCELGILKALYIQEGHKVCRLDLVPCGLDSLCPVLWLLRVLSSGAAHTVKSILDDLLNKALSFSRILKKKFYYGKLSQKRQGYFIIHHLERASLNRPLHMPCTRLWSSLSSRII